MLDLTQLSLNDHSAAQTASGRNQSSPGRRAGASRSRIEGMTFELYREVEQTLQEAIDAAVFLKMSWSQNFVNDATGAFNRAWRRCLDDPQKAHYLAQLHRNGDRYDTKYFDAGYEALDLLLREPLPGSHNLRAACIKFLARATHNNTDMLNFAKTYNSLPGAKSLSAYVEEFVRNDRAIRGIPEHWDVNNSELLMGDNSNVVMARQLLTRLSEGTTDWNTPNPATYVAPPAVDHV
tara:strand:- start:459 stop:1166 length:708 start_codon:yes stop_codon:yes gene_type:complete